MEIDKNEELNIQNQLNMAKRKTFVYGEMNEDIEIDESGSSDIGTAPTWLTNLQEDIESKHPQTKDMLRKLANQLTQLPIISQTRNRLAMKNYYKQITEELTKIYYIRMRLVENNEELTEDGKELKLDNLTNELKAHLLDIAEALGEYDS
ncbi:MAG: hypothetical protein Q8P90_00900 [bacterium]|nr:hypothetical protein [bacterium]